MWTDDLSQGTREVFLGALWQLTMLTKKPGKLLTIKGHNALLLSLHLVFKLLKNHNFLSLADDKRFTWTGFHRKVLNVDCCSCAKSVYIIKDAALSNSNPRIYMHDPIRFSQRDQKLFSTAKKKTPVENGNLCIFCRPLTSVEKEWIISYLFWPFFNSFGKVRNLL